MKSFLYFFPINKFLRVVEQNYIAHVIAFSSCIGPYNSSNHPECTKNRPNVLENEDKLYLMRKRQIVDRNNSISNSKIIIPTSFLLYLTLIAIYFVL